MKVEARWLWQGYFDLSRQDPRATTTIGVRNQLCTSLGLPAGGLHIAFYPVGPLRKHTFWWREGDRDYAEAQFFARISAEHPVLSLGVSVEKGLEDLAAIPAGRRESFFMDRKVWDWPRLLKRAPTLFEKDIPACASAVGRPIFVRITSHRPGEGEETAHVRRTYVFSDGAWFERHVGAATPQGIADYLRRLDERRDWWVNAYIGCDLAPSEADGMGPVEVARFLLALKPVRDKLRR